MHLIIKKPVLVPADKAAKNVTTVWNKFYIDLLFNKFKSI